MRRSGLLLAVLVSLASVHVHGANDYLEQQKHYTVMSMGNGVLRYTIPVWVYGAANDYYLWGSDASDDNNDSYLFWSEHNYAGRGGADVHRFVSVRGVRNGRNDGDNPDGEGYIKVHPGGGTIIVTSAYDGVKMTVTESDGWKHFKLKRKNDDDHKRITYFEFDWYPPASLSGVDFYWGLSANIYKKSSGSSSYQKWWNWPERYTGGNIPQSPQLMKPYFYAVQSHEGEPGRAAIQYVTYQDPISYTTSFNSTTVATTERSGSLFVQTADTVRKDYFATFNVYLNKEAASTAVLKSNSVNIPAYHKPYELKATEVTDQYNSVTGKVNVSWSVHTPAAEELVPNDVFEVQRATREDFSDAQTIAVIPYSADSTQYRLTDDPTSVLRDSVTVKNEPVHYGIEHMAITNAAGDNLCIVNATLYADQVLQPGQPLYYRVRRGSSSIWEWNQPYALHTSLMKEGYLAPLAATQDRYVKDAEFDTNRKVHFYLRLDNKQVQQEIPPKEQCRLGAWQVLSTASGQPLTQEEETAAKNSAIDQLYAKLHERMEPLSNARCNWDKGASLVLTRTIVETGETTEFHIPNDSIIQQSDGSWRAHYVDVAGLMCVHYRYSVRIDQSSSSLKVSNALELQSKPIEGDDLFGSQSAQIEEFIATQGTERRGIHLSWTPTAGGADNYSLARRAAGSADEFAEIVSTTQTDYWDVTEPDERFEYRVIVRYTCHNTTTSDTAYATGWRSPFGMISGRVHYEDGTGCPGVTVQIEANGQALESRVTNDAGEYVFDTLRYGASGTTYMVTPTSQTAQFRYNNTSAGSATLTLNKDKCESTGIEFDNISSVRFSGRVLCYNSSVPVRDARIYVNGKPARTASGYVQTDPLGNFELRVPQNEAFTLQVRKEGHTFDKDGYVERDGSRQLTLTSALDGVRVFDLTKVRLAGRVSGGLVQQGHPLGFGMGTNNLGDDIKLVLELEGDNTSYIVRVDSDLSKDTLNFTVPHLVYKTGGTDTTGVTKVQYQHKRIVIQPDPKTGEFTAELFPVKYKLVQATARGYATLFATGKASETIDLTNAVLVSDTVRHEGRYTVHNGEYRLAYRSPINISCKQLRYGVVQDYFGEETMSRANIAGDPVTVPLVERFTGEDTVRYLFEHPVFNIGKYDFRISVHEDYYYNNVRSGKHDVIPVDGGHIKIYNGLRNTPVTDTLSAQLLPGGEVDVTLTVDNISFGATTADALRTMDISAEVENDYIIYKPFKAYIAGNRAKGRDFMTYTHGKTQLLDILRDPPGSKSYAFIDAGTTYKYNYTYTFSAKFGLNITLGIGAKTNLNMGTVAASVYAGHTYNLSSQYTLNIPISADYLYKNQASYTFTTTDRIETSTDQYYVGEQGDIYIGMTQNLYYGLTDAVKPIDSLTYAFMQGSEMSHTMHVLQSADDAKGKSYYLAVGTEMEAGIYLNSSFYYTHDYVMNTLLPKLAAQRNSLIMTGDSASVQAAANRLKKVMYWSRVDTTDAKHFGLKGYYRQLLPAGYNPQLVYPDEIDAYNRQITDWMDILINNEKEKISALYGNNAETVGNWSVSGGTQTTHTETYEAGNTYTERVTYPGFTPNISAPLNTIVGNSFLKSALTSLAEQKYGDMQTADNNNQVTKSPYQIATDIPGYRFIFDLTPILDFNFDRDPNRTVTRTKKTGFVLHPDINGYMDVSVHRVIHPKEGFNKDTQDTRDQVESNDNGYSSNMYQYGSYVYFLNGGASRCPWESADSTHFYTPKVPISAGTLKISNQKIRINRYEQSNIPADQAAVFTLQLSNETEAVYGAGALPITFYLRLKEGSNPHGAKILIDGMPITGDARTIKIPKGEVITKTMEVYAGEGYDFEDITLILSSPCDEFDRSIAKCSFTVHYMPVSCPVNIATPHDKWTMNTLSPRDSTGYYLPVTIDGFDTNYKEFDHIEFQYKPSTQSEDAWVNQCSFYADEYLYDQASGSKAMIVNGRIENIRFYGGRDPMEQQYDLRAVSFCRHGNGFITRSSAIRTGMKDTRPPRVFGVPQPADAILGVGDELMLRFNEAIAGNYLDEDNNFQVLGTTNTISLTEGTAVRFDGSDGSYAKTKVDRSLMETDFSIDMLVKPTSPDKEEIFFEHGDNGMGWVFGKTADNCLYIMTDGEHIVKSKPLDAPMTAFTRVICTYDNRRDEIHFYAGTKDVTDTKEEYVPTLYGDNQPLVFGRGFNGAMMEARLWNKALTPAEISQTHMKRLTGYEYQLAAYKSDRSHVVL